MARLILVAAIALVLSSSHACAEDMHPIAASVAEFLEDPSQPFFLIVEIKTAPGKAAGFLNAAKEPVAETVKEDGNLAYVLSRVTGEVGEDDDADPAEGREFVFFEHWKSLAALDEHVKQPYIERFLGKLDGLLAGPPELTVSVPVTGE